MKRLILVALPDELDCKLISVPVYYTGVGLTNAAMMTYDAIVNYKPDLIINYGTAGAIKNHIGLQSVSVVCQRDAKCEPLSPRGYMCGEDVLYYDSGVTGVRCGSGNDFVTKPDQWITDNCDIVDMELYAIAKVCKKLNVPWLSMKYISDNADDESGKIWKLNVKRGQKEFIDWFNLNHKSF